MDSSESKLPSAASTSSPVQESPFSNFISSLSPINPVKASHAIQGCLALNSPPLVFTTPRVNTNREANLVERLQPLSGDTTLGRDGGNMTDDGTASSSRIESSVIQYQEAIVAHNKDDGAGKSLQVQTSDSSGSVVGYLTDPVDPDCLNSADSSCTNSKLSVKWFESSVDDHVDSKKTVQEFHEKNVTDSEAEGVIMSLTTKFDEEFEKKLSSNEEVSNASERPHHEYSALLSDPIKSDFMTEKLKHCHVQNDGNDRSEGSPQRLDLALQVILRDGVPAEKVEATLDGRTDHEVNQHQRSISRRCLQFGEAQGKGKAQGLDVSNLFTDAPPSNSLSITPAIEGVDSNCADLSTSQKTKLVNIAQISVELHTKNNCGKSPLAFSKPSGIGLHLNSIVRSIPMASHGTESMKPATQGNLASARRTYSLERMNSHLNAIDETFPIVKDEALETQNFTPVGGSCEPLLSEEQMEHHATPDAKRKFTLDQHENHEECDQQSTKKKRKTSSSTVDEDGCKHCNCKKSKCLKLYCDCFAAGIYCTGTCSCRECLNRPEYQDRVLETRCQIESRNPLAFAPKIIQHNVSSPINGREDGSLTTPSTARHQRGCNCKRSMCLKKYCECYQANVGCSAGCRCEGCKNVYGTREGYHTSEELMSSRIYCEDTFSDKLEMVATKENCLLNELPNPSYHMPLTPSFPCSENKNASETCFLTRRCPTSPESGLTVLSSNAKSSRNSRNTDVVLESNKDKSADPSHLSPASNCPSALMASASSKASDLSNVRQFQFRARSGCISGRSLHWRGSHSPLTPVSQSDGPKKFKKPSSDVGSCCILEDDTPELLKDASIPSKPVKASSPNGKRVSPPHTVLEIGSSCSGPLRSGRKFILKAVPSFPPLTPCVGLKGNTNEDSIIQDTDSNH